MNLEALALLRSEEQMDSFRWDAERNSPGAPARCTCGECETCFKRASMREYRAKRSANKHAGSGRFSLGKTCRYVYATTEEVCGAKIADHNHTGYCQNHRKLKWDHANRDQGGERHDLPGGRTAAGHQPHGEER